MADSKQHPKHEKPNKDRKKLVNCSKVVIAVSTAAKAFFEALRALIAAIG